MYDNSHFVSLNTMNIHMHFRLLENFEIFCSVNLNNSAKNQESLKICNTVELFYLYAV